MRNRQAAFATFLLFFTPFCLSQTPSPAAKSTPAPRPDSGTFVNNTYTNTYFGFSFTLEDGWVRRNLSASNTPGQFDLVVVVRNTVKHPKEAIQLAVDDTSMFHPRLSLQQWFTSLARHMKDDQHMQLLKDMYPVEYAGQSFYRMQYKQSMPGGSLYGSIVATEYKGFFLYWTFIALSEENLETNVDSLRTLSFQNHQK